MRSLLFLCGVLAAFWAPDSWHAALPWCVPPLLAAACLRPLRALFAVSAGLGCAWLVALPLRAPLPVESERVLVQARVLSIPAAVDGGWRFDAAVRFARQPQWPVRRLRVVLPAGAPAPEVGSTWEYAARLDGPRDARARRALLRDHLSGTARVTHGPLTRQIAVAGNGLAGLCAFLARRITDRVADPSAAALLAALAVGATGEVSDRQWRIFNVTGITHLVAISGMHVTFFAMLCMRLARRAWPWLARWRGMPRRELFVAATGVLLAFLYALLSGFSVPAQRTALMLAVFLGAREAARRVTPDWSVRMALLAVLLWDPMAALSAGFWLSFGAVAAIVLLAGARLQVAAPLAGAAHVQGLVTVALLPMTVAIFGSFSAVGVLANVLAIPVFTLLLVPPVLVATAGYLLPGAWPAWIADRLVDLCAAIASGIWPLLAGFADLPAALWWGNALGSWYLLAVVAVLLVLLPLPRRWRWGGIGLLASAFLLRDPRPPAGELWIDVLDTGSSAAVVLRTRSRLVLWGSAEYFGSAGQGFATRVLPALRATGQRRLDLWLPGTLTRDVQHALLEAAAQLRVAAVVLDPGRAAPPEMQSCENRRWRWDGLDFVLAPDGARCRLEVRRGRQQLLLGATTQAAGQDVQAPVVLLPRAASAAGAWQARHGQWFIAALSRTDWDAPAWRRQRDRLHADGATLLATAVDGTLHLRLGGHGLERRPARAGGG